MGKMTRYPALLDLRVVQISAEHIRPDRFEKIRSREAAEKGLDIGGFHEEDPTMYGHGGDSSWVQECVCLEVGDCPKVIHGKQDWVRCS